MIPVSAFMMLACARLGAIHSVVFGGFAAKELTNRIEDCHPKLIITSSCGLEPGKTVKYRPIVDEALELCKGFENPKKEIKRLIVQRRDVFEEKGLPKDEYYDYDDLMAEEEDIAECVPVESIHPLYILCKLLL
jgi:propionyl-CoA synthetase